jgi:hypothetical protein
MSEVEETLKRWIEQVSEAKAQEVIRCELEKPEHIRFEPLMTPRRFAELLGYRGKRPEKGLYELIHRGGVPENIIIRDGKKMKFHPDRVRAWLLERADKAA